MTIGEWTNLIVPLFMVVIAFWRKEGIINILAGIIVFFTGITWLSNYLVLGLCFMGFGAYFWWITIAALFGVRD